jgi:tetratricopeptide (TPR) repeat protein
MSVKIISVRTVLWAAMVSVLVCGCSPTGPGALLKGKKMLDRGDYAGAVAELRTATTLLATNAAAWNYYGVALQGAGQPTEAMNAYQHALQLDRDLIEARLNLGTVFLQQNKPGDARTEFTAYTLRRPNDPEGWLKLGSAQLRLEQTIAAERSFSAVLALKTNEAEAYNGLGLARVQRKKPGEAAQFFAAAVRLNPHYAAALLNLATVYDQYLNNDKAALECYRAYLALEPRPANWDEVNALVNNLEQSLSLGKTTSAAPPATVPPPIVTPNQQSPPATTVAEARPQPPSQPPARPPSKPQPQPVQDRILQSPRAQANAPAKSPAPAQPSRTEPAAAPREVVQVAPEPQIVARPAAPIATARPATPVSEAQRTASASSAPAHQPAENSGLAYSKTGVTPLPNTPADMTVQAAATQPARPKPVVIVPPAPVNFPSYNYRSPGRPRTGDRQAASGAFTQAREAEQMEQWTVALNDYRTAARLDPSWFEAQYNAGVIAQRLQNYSTALVSYEMALAIQPDSVNARYNFALALNAAGYVPDAARELKKILAAHPGEVRAHLALANICAQSLHDPAQARQHYLKVLELDPDNPRTAEIRFWLAANPG